MHRLVLLVCLSINLSKNSYFCFAIVSESGCKGKEFVSNHQIFSEVFFLKYFSRGSDWPGRGLIRSRSLNLIKVRYLVQMHSKGPFPTLFTASHFCVSTASLSIADAKVAAFNLNAKHIMLFLLNFFTTCL